MSNDLVPIEQNSSAERKAVLIALAVKSVISPNSKRAYASQLSRFLDWINLQKLQFSRQTVLDYRDSLVRQGKSSGTVNLTLSAICALAREAKWENAIPANVADGVLEVNGIRRQKQKTGNWLTKAEAETFINAPNPARPKGRRDRVIIGLLVGCGLRRSEVVAVTNGHVQQRDARWCIVDLKGKGGKFRTVQMPSWVKALIDRWRDELQPEMLTADAPVVLRINKGGRVLAGRMDPQSVWYTVRAYCQQISKDSLAPHDLRRTFGKLAHQGGASIEQIQLTYGHSDLRTTQGYLGTEQNLTDAPCDHLGISPDLAS